MANKNAPNGFRAVKHLNGSPYNGQVNQYFVAASDNAAIFVGDLVKLAATEDGNGVQGVTVCTAAADLPVGVVVGFRPDPTNLTLKYRPASTARYILVVDAPDVVFEAQDSGTTASADVGLNVQPSFATAGNTATGVSGQQLDGATKATTAGHMFKISRIVQRPDVELGANGRFEVMFNRHQLAFATAGV